MDGRIGTLEIQYLTRGTDPFVAARLPAITRAIERDFGEALDVRLTRSLGSGQDVYVIRELTAATLLTPDGLALDARVIDQICRSSVDALVDVLVRPNDDVVRFPDQADFLCAFVVDELAGMAADRWYFGAFRKFRQADARRTIEAVLAAHPDTVAILLGRLARRGRLEDLLTLLDPSRVLQLAGDGSAISAGSDVAVLVDAALHLTALAGWEIDDSLRLMLRQALLMKTAGQQPAWMDPRELSMFVWTCVDEAAAMLRARGVARSQPDHEGIDRSLRGPLDWLDGPWLIGQLASIASVPDEVRERVLSRNPIDVVIERITLAIASRRAALRESDSDDTLVARLIAAGQIEPDEVSTVPALRQVLERALRDWRRLRLSPDADARIDDARLMSLTIGNRQDNRPRPRGTDEGVREKLLVNALVGQSIKAADQGEPTAGASLYLLSRAVLDTGLCGLVTVHDVPTAALLSGLAVKWLGLDWPLDGPAHAWTGASSEGETLPSLLDSRVVELVALEEALRTRLHDQQILTGEIDQSIPADVGPWSPDASAALDRIAASLLRAWSRWLPGLAGSSAPFLLNQCLRRAGTVRMTPTSVTVTLEPAPLDIVLEMAGYLRPIEMLPWLAGRSVVFVAAGRRPGA